MVGKGQPGATTMANSDELREVLSETVSAALVPIGQRMARIEKRIEAVEHHLRSVEQRLTSVQQRVTGVQDRIDNVQLRLDNMAGGLATLRKDAGE